MPSRKIHREKSSRLAGEEEKVRKERRKSPGLSLLSRLIFNPFWIIVSISSWFESLINSVRNAANFGFCFNQIRCREGLDRGWHFVGNPWLDCELMGFWCSSRSVTKGLITHWKSAALPPGPTPAHNKLLRIMLKKLVSLVMIPPKIVFRAQNQIDGEMRLNHQIYNLTLRLAMARR